MPTEKAIVRGESGPDSRRQQQEPDPETSADQGDRANKDLTRELVFDGWLSLFDGQSLYGWSAESDADWQVIDGEIRVSSGDPGLLRTTSQFDNYLLELEYKAEPETNSGIFLHTPPRPTDIKVDCYELNIVAPGTHRFPTGSLVGRAATEEVIEADDEWHRIQVKVDGAELEVSVDDVTTIAYTDENPLGRGFIGLQLNSGPIAFRNIRLKPLNVDPLFNGRDLEGWNTDNKLTSEFSVTDDGELHVVNGRGQIETNESFGDFIFSMQCRTSSPGLNSGVFFRCIPGDVMNGYESQIQNQFQEEDRTRPVDCGTGGIFRRANARLVNADDEKWFCKTIIATGPHIAVWVNGMQVCDWTDQREPDPNPRRGLRLEPGTIMLQGHDPTTDILFKDLRAREIEARNR